MSNPTLPIHRVTLHKHGVAYLVRKGAVEGDQIRIALRPSEIDDALKSLVVFDDGGGHVVCVDYDTPDEPAADQALLTIRPGRGLLDLLEGLVGWDTRVEFQDSRAPVEGRIAGIQFTDDEQPVKGATLLVAQPAGAAIRAVPVAQISNVVPLNEQMRHEVQRLLDIRQRAEGSRTLTVRLTPGSHNVEASYLVPCPSWRVSYRVVARSHSDDQAGELLLQGWGIVDNHLAEDLVDVSISLVAGQPISFIYDLSTSRIPTRHKVADEDRKAARPVEFRASLSRSMAKAEVACEMPDMLESHLDVPQFSRRMDTRSLEEFEEQHTSAKSVDMGEVFAYDVTEPVTIPRGTSALVPIINSRLSYRRELLFNESKHAGHPVAALRCLNDSGLVLERGPVTLIENGAYRGEAIVPFTGTGSELFLAYAVELKIRVRVEQKSSTEFSRIEFIDAFLCEQSMSTRSFTYHIENDTDQDRIVIVERDAGTLPGDLHDCPEPQARADGTLRWEVACAARSSARFTVSSREPLMRRYGSSEFSHSLLVGLLQHESLDVETSALLRDLAAGHGRIESNDRKAKQLKEKQTRLHAREEHVRKNIEVLTKEGPESSARMAMVGELQRAEQRFDEIEAELGTLREESQAVRKAIEKRIESAAR